VVEITVQQIRVATTFMLDPDIALLLTYLSRRGYATAFARPGLGGGSITPIIPPNVIAIKGNVRVDYDFYRRSLGVEGSDPREVVSAFHDVWEALKSLGVDLQKALIPCEAVVIASASLSPRFSSNRIETLDLLGYGLRMSEAGFTLEDGDPTSPTKWLHIRIAPVYSSYKPGEKENLHRIEVVYRDEREKVLRLIENVGNILTKLLERV
jgi:hypothetical protein